jgi:hypothetical protein
VILAFFFSVQWASPASPLRGSSNALLLIDRCGSACGFCTSIMHQSSIALLSLFEVWKFDHKCGTIISLSEIFMFPLFLHDLSSSRFPNSILSQEFIVHLERSECGVFDKHIGFFPSTFFNMLSSRL